MVFQFTYGFVYVIGIIGLRVIAGDLAWTGDALVPMENINRITTVDNTTRTGNVSRNVDLMLKQSKKREAHYPKYHKFETYKASISNESTIPEPPVMINSTSSNVTSFEEYEREFLLSQIMNMLEQFLQLNVFRNHIEKGNHMDIDKPPFNTTPLPPRQNEPTALPQPSGTPTTPPERVDSVILETANALSQMDMAQLSRVFGSLKSSSQQGGVDRGISQLCCNMG